MKKLLVLAFLFSVKSFAVTNASTGVVDFACQVNGLNWKEVMSPTVKTVKAITVVNTSASTLYLGIGLNGAASSGDVAQLVVPAATSPLSMQTFEMPVGQGYRISVKNASSLLGAICSGQLRLNAIFN